MKYFCAALTPSRNSVAHIRRSTKAFYDTASAPQLMQNVLRIDEDNLVAQEALPELLREFPNLSCVVGPRYTGYMSMGRFIDEAAAAADAKWHFMYDDDAELRHNTVIDTRHWDTQLHELGGGDVAATCQFYQINSSVYESQENHACTPVGLFVPANFWKRFGIEHITNPADDCWHGILIREKWPIRILKGITYYHAWDQQSPHLKENYVPGT